MSNNQIDKYKSLYSELIGELVELHNSHIGFSKHIGRDTGYAVRKHLRAISSIAVEMKKQCHEVYKEEVKNRKLARLKKAEEKNKKKQNDVAISK